jgi:hypothetical protein
VTRWNHGARRLYGYEETAVVGKPAALLFADHLVNAWNGPRPMLDAPTGWWSPSG